MKEKVASWLRSQGYPLELSVGRILRDHGWNVEHSKWYADPESGKPREIDIYATVYSDQREKFRWGSVGLVIECKQTVGKPWVVFTAPRSTFDLQVSNSIVADDFSRAVLYSIPPELGLPTFLRPSDRVAHAVTRAFVESKSGDPTGPYSALRGVITAASAIGTRNEELALSSTSDLLMADVLLPVVVIDGELFDFSVGEDDEESLIEIPWIQTIITASADETLSIVTIVTRRALADYLSGLTPKAKNFASSMTTHIQNVHDLVRRRRTRAAILKAGGPDIVAQ